MVTYEGHLGVILVFILGLKMILGAPTLLVRQYLCSFV